MLLRVYVSQNISLNFGAGGIVRRWTLKKCPCSYDFGFSLSFQGFGILRAALNLEHLQCRRFLKCRQFSGISPDYPFLFLSLVLFPGQYCWGLSGPGCSLNLELVANNSGDVCRWVLERYACPYDFGFLVLQGLEFSGMPYILNMFLAPLPEISYVSIIWGSFPTLFILD